MTARWSLGHPHRLCGAAFAVATVACSASDVTSPSSGEARSAGPTSGAPASLLGLTGRIAFERSADGSTYEIYKMNADGSGVTRLTTNKAEDGAAVWSPDGKKIAFESSRAGNWEIYVMNSDGGAPTRLTNNPAKDLQPAWSPDGKKIAFVSARGSRYNNGYAIYVMNVTGSGVTRLTIQCQSSLFSGCGESSPAWSPDGRRIVFAHKSGLHSAILEIMNADGSGVTPVPNTGPDVGAPAWGSSGKIAFETSDGIFVIKPDGSGRTRLTHTLGWGDEHPSWSLDGTKIAFSSDRTFSSNPTGHTQIYVMNANGSSVTRVSRNSALQDFEPAWGP
jgi:Tol biopolymer transport system component